MIGIALALLSAATSSLAIILVRKNSKDSNVFGISLVVSCVGFIILWPIAILLTDFGATNLESLILFVISGLLAPGIVRLLYYSGLKRLGASVNASIFSIYPLYSSLLAVLLLNEILSTANWLGILFIILGVIFVEMSSREINSGDKTAKKGLIFPILGGLTIGTASIIRKYALNLCDVPVLGIAIGYTSTLLVYGLILTLSAPTRKALSLKRDFRLFWKVGIFLVLSWTFIFYALSYEQVSIVNPLCATEPLFVILFAYLYLRELEHLSPKIVASIILTVLGVILVTT